MSKSKAFWRNHKYEIITFIVNASVAIVVFRVTPQLVAFIVSFLIFILSTFILIYYKTTEKNFYYYPFDVPGQEQDWVGRGDLKFIRNEKCFEITNSDVGFILPKTLTWDDYRYEFDFKISKKFIGFIVRAVNLSNYLMYQILDNRLRPHLRINGEWIVMDEIKFEEKLKLDIWYKIGVTCEKRKVRVHIENVNESLFDRHLEIPLQIVLAKKQTDEAGNETQTIIRFIQNIDFDFGAVGIRNAGEERALIKNIFIEKL